jgi:hypothetical protein
LHVVEQATLVQAHDFFATPTSWLAIELQVSIAHTLLEAGIMLVAPNLQDGLCSPCMRGFRLLTLAPRVHERDGVLRARTSILIRLLSLGTVRREVVVDRSARYVMIDERYL